MHDAKTFYSPFCSSIIMQIDIEMCSETVEFRIQIFSATLNFVQRIPFSDFINNYSRTYGDV